MSQEFRHDSRCSKCKSTIYEMLYHIYGKGDHKYKPNGVFNHIEKYEATKVHKPLKKIYTALTEYRGNKDFVKAKTLQRCDLYIPSKKYVIELDEVQHFSYPRYITLKSYPRTMAVGFNIKRYQNTCEEMHSTDNDPSYRDEQRAWYDTPRDFLPLITPDEVKLTLRIQLGFFKWCSLDPKNSKDKAVFKTLTSFMGELK